MKLIFILALLIHRSVVFNQSVDQLLDTANSQVRNGLSKTAEKPPFTSVDQGLDNVQPESSEVVPSLVAPVAPERINETILGYSLLISRAYDPDQGRTTCEIVTARGFLCDVHIVTTYQGYQIELHRIVNPNKTPNRRYPVILQPGLIGSSSDFIMASSQVSPDPAVMGQNMGFELSKRGYDVWLSNNRGGEYGFGHSKLKASDREFWRFSFDEISEYDTPAIVDYVRNATNAAKVHFIGHSQGTAVMFGLLSQTDLYNDRLASFIAISPITRIGDAKTSFRLLVTAIKPYLILRNGPVFTKNFISETVVPVACDFLPTRFVCKQVFFSICGPDDDQLDKSRIPVYMSHMPTSTSAQNLLHFDQLFSTNKFQKYDYGLFGNLRHYGQLRPPIYDLRSITYRSMYVIYSDNDWFVPLSGVHQLEEDLAGQAEEFYRISNPKANHMDPLVGVDVAVEVNRKVVDILKRND